MGGRDGNLRKVAATVGYESTTAPLFDFMSAADYDW
jgi:hypothetical protein